MSWVRFPSPAPKVSSAGHSKRSQEVRDHGAFQGWNAPKGAKGMAGLKVGLNRKAHSGGQSGRGALRLESHNDGGIAKESSPLLGRVGGGFGKAAGKKS